MIDKILEKPVYLDRLKNEIQELISTINIQQTPDSNKIKVVLNYSKCQFLL